MIADLVVDASVAVKWLIQEEGAHLAERILKDAETIRAPRLIMGEVANALWKKVRQGAVDAEIGSRALEGFPGYIADFFEVDDLRLEAFEMAVAHDHPVYDCFYIAGARRLKVPLVTADARLARKFAGTPLAGHILPLTQWQS